MVKISVSKPYGDKQWQGAVIEVPVTRLGNEFLADLLVRLTTEWAEVVIIEVP